MSTTTPPARRPGNPNMVKGAPSINPAGRPKGFAGVAKMIAERTQDGAALVEYAMKTWTDVTIPHADRWRAFEWLSNRYMGTPVAMGAFEVHTTEVRAKKNLAILSEDKIAQIDRIFREAEGLPVLGFASVEVK